MRRLLNEIKAVNDKNKETSKETAVVTVAQTSNKTENEKNEKNSKPLNDWTNEEVLNWLKENKLSEIIIEAFQAYTGDDLAHL
jgi:3'-phosphoadenosine 5'-phosphosulfate sulfotransferase (PAPS reductase)/FAD synthetase